MRVTIDFVLQQQKHTRYWLSQQINCNYYSLAKLCNNETTSISFSQIQNICDALRCTPSDIFDITVD
jgi:putative transcriptional regulator